MQTTEILRTEVKFRFIDYLKAAQILYYDPPSPSARIAGSPHRWWGTSFGTAPIVAAKEMWWTAPWKATASEKPSHRHWRWPTIPRTLHSFGWQQG